MTITSEETLVSDSGQIAAQQAVDNLPKHNFPTEDNVSHTSVQEVPDIPSYTHICKVLVLKFERITTTRQTHIYNSTIIPQKICKKL